MLISSAPIVIPVNTANLPTESLVVEAAQRPTIPQPSPATENSSTKNSTEFANQPKPTADSKLQAEAAVEEKQQQGKEQASDNKTSQNANNEELETEEIQQVQKLRSRDREVKAHEQAHASVGGSLAGSPNLNFTTGPDGKRYAVSGDVSIDVSKVANDPAATVRKLGKVQRAALAPAEPSSQDRKVASQAASSANQARTELRIENLQQSQQQETQKNEQANVRTLEQASDNLSSDQPPPAETAFTEQPANAITARRRAAQLNQKIAGSGALDLLKQNSQLSLIA